jgi:hypothetical protein
MDVIWIESFCTQKTHNGTLFLVSTLLKHGRHFDYWNQHFKMDMCGCYLNCHEAGLWCYLVIHVENLLHPLQIFYFHLWPIYTHCLVPSEVRAEDKLTTSEIPLINKEQYPRGLGKTSTAIRTLIRSSDTSDVSSAIRRFPCKCSQPPQL